MRTANVRRCRRAASLVEPILTLTVLAVVGALAWKTCLKAVHSANNTRIALELTRLTEALEAFRNLYGDYPPDFHDPLAVRAFMKQRFPKCPPANYPDFSLQSPASALYFWLAGPDGQGFSPNPKNPFASGGTARIGPFFEFSPERLKETEGAVEYLPPRKTDGEPYLYFRAGKKGYDGHDGWGKVSPYRNSETGKWINPDSFQILCPGNDGKFGSGRNFPAGDDYDEFNDDDMTNFSGGMTLRQAKP